MKEKYDTIVVGAGIAGLGVAAILANEGKQKVLVLDRFPVPGGRLRCYPNCPAQGWTIDTGLHFIELGAQSSAHELNSRVGKSVAWAPLIGTVQFWDGEKFEDLANRVPKRGKGKATFESLLEKIASLSHAQMGRKT